MRTVESVEVCEAQELVFKLMRFGSFNAFDGAVVVDSLLGHRHLWRGCVFGSFEPVGTPSGKYPASCLWGCTLRDIQDGVYNADTLYLTCPAGADDALEALARTWLADEIDWENVPNAGKALRVWWD